MTTYTLDELRGTDRIDSRDLIESMNAAQETIDTADADNDRDDLAVCRELIDAVRELADAGIEDWEYGASMIREDTFEDYARELAEDIGQTPVDGSWPASYINWPAAAAALAGDYTSVTFLGHDYYVR